MSLRRGIVYGALCVLEAGACAHVALPPGPFARVIDPGEPVQWDFAQLDDWFNVIVSRAFERRIVPAAGIDVMRNRIPLNAEPISGRRSGGCPRHLGYRVTWLESSAVFERVLNRGSSNCVLKTIEALTHERLARSHWNAGRRSSPIVHLWPTATVLSEWPEQYPSPILPCSRDRC